MTRRGISRFSLVIGLIGVVSLGWLIATQSLAAQSYDIGKPSDKRLAIGFWSGESNADGSYRWSDGDSSLRLYGYGTARSLLVSFRLIGPQGSRGGATTLTLQANGRPLLQGEAPPAWRTYRLLLAPGRAGWETPHLTLASTTVQAAQGDARAVGVAVSRVWVKPLQGQRPLAVAEYAAFAVTLMGLVWFGLHRLVGGYVGPAAALGMGLAWLAWASFAPLDSAYYLPPLWGAALPIVVGLGVFGAAQRLALALHGSLRWRAVGLGMALAGIIALRVENWQFIGGTLFVGGIVIALATRERNGAATPAALAPGGASLRYAIALAGCFALALALRISQLDNIPFGLWRDEARHGLLALRILNDPLFRPVYVPVQADIPALLFYLQAASVWLFGPTAFAVRLVPALAGSLTVFPIYLLGRYLWGSGAGLAAAFLLAVSSWHITLSRLAIAAVLDPLFTLTALYLLLVGLDRKIEDRKPQAVLQNLPSAFYFPLAGLFLGLALYTYHPARLMPLVAAALVVYQLGRNWRVWRRAAPGLAALALATLLVALPLLVYTLSLPGDFNRRVGQVSLLDRENERRAITVDLDRNAARYELMWHVVGDANPRHNLPGLPMLDPFSGLGFAVGLALLLVAWRQATARFLLTFLLIGLMPGLLSDDAPHAVRTVDAIAPAMLIAAYGVIWSGRVVVGWATTLRAAGLVAVTAGALLFNAWVYFGLTPYDPRIWTAFSYVSETRIGGYVHSGMCAGPLVVPQTVADTDVMRYLAYDRSVETFAVEELPARFPSGACVLLPDGIARAEQARIEQVIGPATRPQPMAPYPGTERPTFWLYRAP